MITFNEQQSFAIEKAIKSLDKVGIFKIGGYAGTGKSSIAKEIIMSSGRKFAVCTYMGKAASVLRQKGIKEARTIHKTIYDCDEKRDWFYRKDRLDCDAIFIDEASMVPKDILNDLVSYKKPIIAVGDPGQLEPIGVDAHLMRNPDVVLTKIYRNEGSIAQFADYVRRHGTIPTVRNLEVFVTEKTDFMRELKLTVANRETIICGFNKTRVAVNKQVRDIKGYSRLLHSGETLICLQNNQHYGIFNGTFLYVEEVIHEDTVKFEVTAITDDGRKQHYKLWKGGFNNGKTEYRTVELVVDYGYCVTCHKFQGSEDARVTVIDEQANDLWDATRWRYTAFTRAQEHLNVYVG